MEFENFLGQMSPLMYYESAIEGFFPTSVPSSMQVLFQVDKSDKLDYLKNPSLDLKNSFCFEFLAMLKGQIRECLFFMVQSDEIKV